MTAGRGAAVPELAAIALATAASRSTKWPAASVVVIRRLSSLFGKIG